MNLFRLFKPKPVATFKWHDRTKEIVKKLRLARTINCQAVLTGEGAGDLGDVIEQMAKLLDEQGL